MHIIKGHVLYPTKTMVYNVPYTILSPDMNQIASFELELSPEIKADVYGDAGITHENHTPEKLDALWEPLRALMFWDLRRMLHLGLVKLPPDKVSHEGMIVDGVLQHGVSHNNN